MPGPSADLFLPGAGSGRAAAGGGKILGLSRNWFIVAAAGGLVLVYVIYRRSRNAGAAAAAAAPSPTDPSAGLSTSTNGSGAGGGPTDTGASAQAPAPAPVDPLLAFEGVVSGYSQLVSDLLAAQNGSSIGQPLPQNALPPPGSSQAPAGSPYVPAPTPANYATTPGVSLFGGLDPAIATSILARGGTVPPPPAYHALSYVPAPIASSTSTSSPTTTIPLPGRRVAV